MKRVNCIGVFIGVLVAMFTCEFITTGADVSAGSGSGASISDSALIVDESLYSMWRTMDQGTNAVPVLIANAVAADRLRLSHTLLGRINSWINNYANTHSNQMPSTLTEMLDVDKTCPVLQLPFTYFPVNTSNRIVDLVVSTVPKPIKFITQTGTKSFVVVLLANGDVKEFDGPGFASYAMSNNVLRADRGLLIIPTNVILQLSQP